MKSQKAVSNQLLSSKQCGKSFLSVCTEEYKLWMLVCFRTGHAALGLSPEATWPAVSTAHLQPPCCNSCCPCWLLACSISLDQLAVNATHSPRKNVNKPWSSACWGDSKTHENFYRLGFNIRSSIKVNHPFGYFHTLSHLQYILHWTVTLPNGVAMS